MRSACSTVSRLAASIVAAALIAAALAGPAGAMPTDTTRGSALPPDAQRVLAPPAAVATPDLTRARDTGSGTPWLAIGLGVGGVLLLLAGATTLARRHDTDGTTATPAA